MKSLWKIGLIFLLVVAIPAAAQVIIKQTPAKYVPPYDGKQLYSVYCASCHGDSLMGNQAVQTTVARNINLKSSNAHIVRMRSQIEFGSNPYTNGVKMPSWAEVLRQVYAGDDAKTQVAIYNLTRYISTH